MIAAAAAVRIFSAGALGAVSGLLGGLFGIGGGVIAIPLLGLLYGLHQQIAQGTVLVMVVPNVLFGFWGYRRRVGVDLRIATALALSAAISTYPPRSSRRGSTRMHCASPLRRFSRSSR